jgi:hypothetical protein
MMTSSLATLPTWLLVPGASDAVDPPVIPVRGKILPLHQLSFENFQRLSVRLLEAGDSSLRCREYGLAGQKQQGIDIYARLPGRMKDEMWQCKRRYESITAATIHNAAREFMAGELVDEAERFVIATSALTEDVKLLDAERKIAQELNHLGIDFELLGRVQLSARLEGHPQIIDDFFGREWVQSVCGSEVSASLGERLSKGEVSHLREALRNLYETVFDWNDAYVTSALQTDTAMHGALSLAERWVMPGVVSRAGRDSIFGDKLPEDQQDAGQDPRTKSNTSAGRKPGMPLEYEANHIEMSVDSFLGGTHRAIILGEPGSGKSAMLRMVALDLLSPSPALPNVVGRFGNCLPVWLPFAFLSQQLGQGNSIIDAAAAWLKMNGDDTRLDRLVRRAMADKRLLLLVDGLDEWSEIDSARACVANILGFLRIGDVACIVTARPLGYRKLDPLPPDWKRGNLMPLNSAQQHDLALRLIRSFSPGGSSATLPSSKIAVDNLIRMVRQDDALSRMAGTPLLLIGLVSLFLRNQTLPHSRFLVCGELIREILENHPSRRSAASLPSLSTRRFQGLAPQDQRDAIAYLAMTIHRSADSTVMSREDAEHHLISHFEQDGIPRPQAKEYARSILPKSSNDIGILSEAGPSGEIQFIHRTFQEFLTAEYFHSRSLSEQADICFSYAGSPVWYQVILFLLQNSKRLDDTQRLLEALEAPDLEVFDENSRNLLVAEAVFSNIRLENEERTRRAEAILDEIETGPWLPLREWLLEATLAAPYGSKVYELLVQRLRVWTPMRESLRWAGGLCRAIEHWPEGSSAEETLWRLLGHEEEFVQIEAAKALGRRMAGHTDWRNRLLARFREPVEPETQAACLLGLAAGWCDDPEVTALFRAGLESGIAEMRVASVYGLTRAGKHDARCKSVLTEESVPVWYNDVAKQAALEGWPGNAEIRDSVLAALDPNPHRRSSAWLRRTAWRLLIDGFSGDPHVAERIAEILDHIEESVFFDFDYPDELIQKFGYYPVVQSAAARLLDRLKQTDFYGSPIIAGFARSSESKRLLLGWMSKNHMWAAHASTALIAGWGTDDPEIRESLRSVPPHDPRFPILAPNIVRTTDDLRGCLDLISEHLKHGSQDSWFGHLIAGVRLLRESGVAIDSIHDLLVDRFLSLKGVENFDVSGVEAMIRLLPNHPRISRWVKTWHDDRYCGWATIAEVRAGDPVSRKEIHSNCRFLPESLRLAIAFHCRQQAPSDANLRSIAAGFRTEHNRDVSVVNAVAVAEATVFNHEESSKLEAFLVREAFITGPDHEVRNQMGIAGLISLRRLESMMVSDTADSKIRKIRFGYEKTERLMLPIHMVRNWEYLRSVLGEGKWGTFFETHELQLLRNAARSLGEESIVQQIDDELRMQNGEIRSLESRARDRSEGWIDDCLFAMGFTRDGESIGYTPQKCEHASHLLVTYGRADESIRKRLEVLAFANSGWTDNALVTLARGWPDSELLKEDWENRIASTPDTENIPYWQAGTYCDVDTFVLWVRRWIRRISSTNYYPDFRDERWFVMRRCFTDSEVRAALLRQLQGDPSIHEMVSLPWLVRGGGSEETERALEYWAQRQLSNEKSLSFPRFGYDLFKTTMRSLHTTMLELLLTDRRYSDGG